MINTLIVDDEDILRKGLIALIDWKNLGFQITGEASNGREATDFIANNPVDLVISDIRMPIVNGIDLMRSVREKNKNIKFIILSGYDDFSYARSALKYGAVSYLLKPFEEEEMVTELVKVKKDIVQFTMDEQKKAEYEAAARSAFLLALLNKKVDRELFESSMAKLPIDFPHGEFQVVVLEFTLRSNAVSLAAERLVKPLIGVFKSGYQGEALFQTAEYNKNVCECVYMFNGRACIDTVNSFIQKLHAILEDFEIEKYNIGIGSEVTDFDAVSQSYQNAKDALGYKISYGNKSVISFANTQETMKSPCHYPQELDLKIMEALQLETPQKLETYLNEFFEYIRTSATNIKTVRKFVFKLISSYKHQYGIEDNNFDLNEITPFIVNCDDVDEINEYLENIFMGCFSAAEAEPSQKGRKLIEDVKEYVNSHYSEKITLEDISKIFFISRSYFCRVFKQYTGANFYHYLNFLRIEKAKSLLKHSYYKNYEICEMIGFENSSYFNQLFKKVTGMTPSEYRNAANPSQASASK